MNKKEVSRIVWSFSGDKSCHSWSGAVWDDLNGNVYGCISNDGEICLPASVHEIKKSQYYAVVEKLEEEGKVVKA